MSDQSSSAEFEEREERLKERFLELEDVTDSDGWEAHVIGEEDEEERAQRESRERSRQREEEQRAAELAAIQEIYKRASKRAFRRLKNLPEPGPGCHDTGTGEEEEERRAHFPGEVEETNDIPHYATSKQTFAAGNSGGAYTSGVTCPLAASGAGMLKRSYRRRRRRGIAALMRARTRCGTENASGDSHFDITPYPDREEEEDDEDVYGGGVRKEAGLARPYHTDTIPPPSPATLMCSAAVPHPPKEADAIAALLL